jgi:hypothetical protein
MTMAALVPEYDGGAAGGGASAVAPSAEPPRLLKFHAPEIVFGIDSMVEAARAALRLGALRPLLVTDPGLIEAGWVAELVGHLRAQGVDARVWSALTPNPKDHEVAAGYEYYRERGCDVLIALGGGSVIDAAKGVAILAANGGNILDYAGVDKATMPIPPLVVVPTTSGTGADVSQFCIVTDTARGTKITILGRALVPDITVIDPRVLTTMPEWLNAATGLDALTHGIEAFVSLGHNQLTDHHALRAVVMVTDNLVRTIEKPNEMSARVLMAQASLEAGRWPPRPAAWCDQRSPAAPRDPVQRRGGSHAVRHHRQLPGARRSTCTRGRCRPRPRRPGAATRGRRRRTARAGRAGCQRGRPAPPGQDRAAGRMHDHQSAPG